MAKTNLNICRICGKEIHVQCRKMTGLCSENCQKAEEAKKSKPKKK